MKKALYITAAALLCLFLPSCSGLSENRETEANETEMISESQTEESEAEETTKETESETEESSGEDVEPENESEESSEEKILRGEKDDRAQTYTGLSSLKKKKFELPENTDYSSFSRELIDHSFGGAKDGKPNPISVENQKFMDENKFDALCYDNKTDKKIIYLTFDVGYENGYTAKVLDVLKDNEVPAAFFCTQPELEDNAKTISRMINEGHIIGNHSVNHPNFSKLSQDEIIKELQGFDDYIRENFGYSSTYFRFPEGKYSEFSEKIITDLGYTSVFWSIAYADWDLKNQPSAEDALDTLISRLHPGAVILLHAVSPVNYEILPDFIRQSRKLGYEFVPMTEYK